MTRPLGACFVWGRCCRCEAMLAVPPFSFITLPFRADKAGFGWGCTPCGLAPVGALALVCFRCVRILKDRPSPIDWLSELLYYVGAPFPTGRRPIAELHGADRMEHAGSHPLGVC